MKLLWSAIISLTLLSMAQAQDTVTYDRKLITPLLYWDYGKTATYWTSFESKTELGAGIMILDRFMINGEYGISQLTPRNAFQNIKYEIEGNYYRVGVGYLGYVDPKNRIGLGLMYGSSTFEDTGEIQYVTSSGASAPYVRSFNRKNLNGSWAELNLITQRYLTLKKSEPEHWINRTLSMGIVIRYRKLLSSSQLEEIPNYYSIPGFGRSTTENVMALNFFIRVSI